jgi:hypothetical protein
MGAQTGTFTILSAGDAAGGKYPLVNPWFDMVAPVVSRKTKRQVFAFRLKGTAAAIATDAYTFTLFTTDKIMHLVSAFIMDPVGLSVDATNYNTFAITKTGPVTMASSTSAYGVSQFELHELTKANTLANRTLAATNVVYCVITGSSAGRIINGNTLLFLVFDDA